MSAVRVKKVIAVKECCVIPVLFFKFNQVAAAIVDVDVICADFQTQGFVCDDSLKQPAETQAGGGFQGVYECGRELAALCYVVFHGFLFCKGLFCGRDGGWKFESFHISAIQRDCWGGEL